MEGISFHSVKNCLENFLSIMLIKVKEELERCLYLVQIILNIWSILTLWIRALVTFLICVLNFGSVEIMSKWFRLSNLALDQILFWVKLEGFYNTATPHCKAKFKLKMRLIVTWPLKINWKFKKGRFNFSQEIVYVLSYQRCFVGSHYNDYNVIVVLPTKHCEKRKLTTT